MLLSCSVSLSPQQRVRGSVCTHARAVLVVTTVAAGIEHLKMMRSMDLRETVMKTTQRVESRLSFAPCSTDSWLSISIWLPDLLRGLSAPKPISDPKYALDVVGLFNDM